MTAEQVSVAAVFLSNFAGRTDDFVEWRDGHWERAGRPLTAETLVAAFAARKPLSVYFSGSEGTSHVAAVDFDTEDGWDAARRLRDVMDAAGAFAYIEPSRRGAHLWCVLADLLPTRTIRRALHVFLSDAGIEESPKIELRPSHDGPVQYGSPLRLPTMYHPKTGKRYPLCGADDRPLGSTLADILLRIEWARPEAFIAAAERYRPPFDPRAVPPGLRPIRRHDDTARTASEILRDSWGVANAMPGRSVNCPAHPDDTPSLSIARDDDRAWCHVDGCDLNNAGRGRGTNELERMAPLGGAPSH